MRKRYLLLLLIASVSGFSQNKQLLYNFTSIPQSSLINPGADVNYNYFFGVPLLSGISINAGSTGFSVYDLFANDGVDFNSKVRNVLNKVSNKDKVAINEQIELFTAGFSVGRWDNIGFISFGMYQEFDFVSYLPRDLGILALDGNRDYIGKKFNLGELNAKTEMLSVLHVGYHKNLRNNLIIGARAKLYSSAFNATSTSNSGYIYTILDDQTVYKQFIYSNLTLNTAGIANYYEDSYTGNVSNDLMKKLLLGGNLGLGLDLGLTYYPKNNVQLTASILDFGFINQAKEVKTFTYKGFYEYEGINPNFQDPNNSGSTYQEFRDAIPYDTTTTKYATWRPVKFNASYQYSFQDSRADGSCNCSADGNNYKNSIGVQAFMQTMPISPIAALTLYYRRELFENLQLKATYTADSYSFTNVGLGLTGDLGRINLYVLADNLLQYKDLSKANSLSFQIGLNFIVRNRN
jgi:hypothetical protein